MSDTRWQTTKAAGIPCGACGTSGTCTVAPDGTAFKCWRDGGKVRQVNGSGTAKGSGTGYVGLAHRPKPHPTAAATAPTTRKPVHPTPEAATAAAAMNIPGRTRAGEWSYRDAAGEEVMRVTRFDLADGSKQFRPIHKVEGGWCVGDPAGPLPLYHLDALPDDGAVYVCEGEKATDAARAVGLPATTSAHGSSSAAKSDWTPLAGRDVVILPDNDEPGRKYAAAVASILFQLSPPSRVRVVELPGLPEGGDMVEYIEARAGVASEAILAEVEAIAGEVPPLDPLGDWPEPTPLPVGLPPVMAFDYEMLPSSLRPWIKDIAERVQCPPDFVAVSAVVGLASVIGRKVGIRPKRKDEWQVVPNLWGALVGKPGIMKTPAMQEALKPLRRLVASADEKYKAELRKYEVEAEVAAVKKRQAKDKIKRAVENGEDAHLSVGNLLTDEAVSPNPRRYIVNDSTVEKLGELLAQNDNGLLVVRDELIGLLKSLDREGQESARAFYLEAWNGGGDFVYDRIGRGTVRIDACCVSVLGGIQPGPLGDYLKAAAEGGAGDDGFMQRFQLGVYPDISREWVNVDRWPDTKAKNDACDVYKALDEMTAESVGAERAAEGLPFLRFDEEAQLMFDDWRAALEQQLRADGEKEVILNHLSKYRSLVPSLALIDHLAEGYAGHVTAQSVRRAIAWATYLESHARRIFAVVVDGGPTSAAAVVAKITEGKLADGFTTRDVYRPQWSKLKYPKDAEIAVGVLIHLGWLKESTEMTGGRETIRHWINPKLYERGMLRPKPGQSGTVKTAQSATHPPSDSFGSGASGPIPTPNRPASIVPSACRDSGPGSDAPDDGWERGEL